MPRGRTRSMSYAPSTYGETGGFVPSAPGTHGSESQNESQSDQHDPVIPSPARGAQGLNWHPGGPSFMRGGDQSWMAFGEPNARGPVFPPAAQQWTHGRGRNQDALHADARYTGGVPAGGGFNYGQSPYGPPPMTVPAGPSPYLHSGMMPGGPDPYFTHGGMAGMAGMGMPHVSPAMGMPMNMMYNTPGMYPQMMGGGMGAHPWGSPAMDDMGMGGFSRGFHDPAAAPAMLGHRKMGRAAESAVFVDKWEPGKHYGPVLDARTISILKPTFEINPLLLSSTARGEGDYLEWNMLFPVNSAHLSSEPRHQSWRAGRDAPAIIPRTEELVIISPFFKWIATIKSPRPGKAITCEDLLHELFRFLHTYAQPDEYNALGRTDPQRHRAIYQNWQRNRSREYRDVPGGSLPDGMLKIDFLMLNTLFDGFYIDDKLARERFGFGAVGSDRRAGQGGPGMCVLILVCGGRAGGSASVGHSPSVRITEMGPSTHTTPSGMSVPL